jgi:hypothetical protein
MEVRIRGKKKSLAICSPLARSLGRADDGPFLGSSTSQSKESGRREVTISKYSH